MMVSLALLKMYRELNKSEKKDFLEKVKQYLEEKDPVIATIARETGSAALIAGGFYAAVVTGFMCPPAFLGIAAAGALWLYGNRGNRG